MSLNFQFVQQRVSELLTEKRFADAEMFIELACRDDELLRCRLSLFETLQAHLSACLGRTVGEARIERLTRELRKARDDEERLYRQRLEALGSA